MNTVKYKALVKYKHCGKYTYDELEYTGSKTKVTITCPLHGNFQQRAKNHLEGQGCIDCACLITRHNGNSHLVGGDGDYIKKITEVHKGLYGYEGVNYTGSRNKVKILCYQHGVFEQIASNHLRGDGCPKCSKSGFDTGKKAFFYVLISSCGQVIKIGITNKTVEHRASQINNTTDKAFFILQFYEFSEGYSALDVETRMLRYMRELYKNPIGKYDGITESFLSVNRETMFDKINETILDILPVTT